MSVSAPIGIYQSLHYNRVQSKVLLDHLLNNVRVQKQQSSLGRLVVHVLPSSNELVEELGAVVEEFLLGLATNDLDDFLDLSDVHYLFGWASDRPKLKQALYKLDAKLLVLLKEVLHTGHQLGVEGLKVSHLVQRDENSLGKVLVLLLQRRSIPGYYSAQDL